MLCGDIRTEMVEHKICLLTWARRHIGHLNNAGEDRSVEVDLYGAGISP